MMAISFRFGNNSHHAGWSSLWAYLAIVTGFFATKVSTPLAKSMLAQTSIVNFFWTVINLVPVLPLDGGQLLRLGLEKWFDFKGLRYTFLVSGIFALLASFAMFATGNLLAGAIFFLFCV
jgi:stage IV sporulation protein FB